MIPDEAKLKLINTYALAIVAFVSISLNIWQHLDRIAHDTKDVDDYKKVIEYKDKIIEVGMEQKDRTDEMERASRLFKK